MVYVWKELLGDADGDGELSLASMLAARDLIRYAASWQWLS